jgi:magnesium-protoporphyrin O-methyltransferase
MNCCNANRYDVMFDVRMARKDLKHFRKDGPDPTTQALIDVLVTAGVKNATVLDIGGGVGAIQHALLEHGAASTTDIDASAEYLRAAEEEGERRGVVDKMKFVFGDFVAVAPDIPPVDVVTLDKVICCYPDMEALVAASASRAKRLYGAVFPRERWSVRIGFAAVNVFMSIMRRGFRVYVHPVTAIDAALRREGLSQRAERQTFVWRVVVYSR